MDELKREETKQEKLTWRRRIREEERRLAKEFRTRIGGYIIAALGLVAGLAWNEAIKSVIVAFFPSLGGDMLAKFLYAILVTVFIVIVSFYIMRLTQDHELPKK
jgi:hypothetical protein